MANHGFSKSLLNVNIWSCQLAAKWTYLANMFGVCTLLLVCVRYCWCVYVIVGVYTLLLVCVCYCWCVYVIVGVCTLLLACIRYCWCVYVNVGVGTYIS